VSETSSVFGSEAGEDRRVGLRESGERRRRFRRRHGTGENNRVGGGPAFDGGVAESGVPPAASLAAQGPCQEFAVQGCLS
jgi:hypothetical protein